MAISQASPEPTIVGRERETARGARLIAEMLAGKGALLLISGEAGIGKTALAEAIAASAAAHGADVCVGRCYDLTETPPYGPWVELFAQFPAQPEGPLLPAPFTPLAAAGAATSQGALFAAVRAYLTSAAADRPLVLLLDDLHWADTASLDLLHVLARHSAQRAPAPLPILLIATYRGDELDPGHPLALMLPALVRESTATRFDLRRLDDQAVRALVAMQYGLSETDTTRLVRYLRARADGNPLFIGEIVRTLEDEAILSHGEGGWTLGDIAGIRVPALLRHLIDRRMTRLDDEARGMLSLAALIGQEVPLSLWSAVADADEASLFAVVERAMAARILEASESSIDIRFTHALIRQALYESTVPPQRRLWHRRVAETLAALPAPDPDAIAYHFRQAGDARAASWLIRAGERAQRAYAWHVAAERFATAVTLMERDGTERHTRGWLLIRLAWLRRYSLPQEGLAALDDAARIAREEQDAPLAAYATFYRGIVRYHRGEVQAGLAEMGDGMTALDAVAAAEGGSVGIPADILAYAGDPRGTLVGFLAGTGHYAEAVRVGERTLRGAAPGVEVSHGLGIAYAGLGKPEEARNAFQRTCDGFRSLGQYLSVGEGAMDELRWVTLPYHADHPAERARLATEAEEAWGRARGALDGLPPRLARLTLTFIEGSWGEARSVASAARATGVFRNMARTVLGPLARAQGDTDLAWAVVREDLPAGPESVPGDTYFPTALILIRLAAALALDAGDLGPAHAWLEAHDRWLAWSGSVAGRAEGMLGWAAAHRTAGEARRAYECAAAALVAATAPRQPLALLAAYRLLGELDTDAGRLDDARGHLDAALALADACVAPYERAQTLLALAATQDASNAEGALRAAHEIARALGARPLLARILLRLGSLVHLLGRYADAERAYLAAQTVVAEQASGMADSRARGPFLDAAMADIPQAYRLQPGKPDYGGLTAREREVVGQIARGKSNRAIADALFIAEKTVEMHVSNSLSKLGFRSRSQLAAWAVARESGNAISPESPETT